MEKESKRVTCADCGADVTEEKIKFQKEGGSILCEKCYILAGLKGGTRHRSVRAIVVALRLAAYAVLALTLVTVLSRIAAPDYAVLQLALYGTLAFLLFIGLSEGINMVLALRRQVLENKLKLDKIFESVDRIGISLSGNNSS